MSRNCPTRRSTLRRAGGLLAAALLLALASCQGNATTATEATAPSASVNPWDAPVGDPVQGATLSDGWHDLRIVPAPVNVDGGWTDSVAVTPNGKHLYFAYTQNDFTEFFYDFTVDPSGPLRTGMTDPWFHIFRADLTADGWVVTYHPLNSPQNGSTLYGQASASPNAAGDLIVYSQFDSTGKAALNYSTLSGGTWAAPIDLNAAASPMLINPGCQGGADNGFVIGSVDTQVTVVWESRFDYVGACGTKHHLWWTTYTAADGSWTPVSLIPGLNDIPNDSDDSQPSFTPDGRTAFWSSYGATRAYGIYTADWDGSSYANVRPIVLTNITPPYTGTMVLVGEANEAPLPEGDLLYLMCGIANSESVDGNNFPNDVTLKVCVARK
jgi:WD40-like Beta Propeller Repeat